MKNTVDGQAQSGIDCRLQNAESAESGSIACILQSNSNEDKYILTCSHVVLSGSSRDLGGFVTGQNASEIELTYQGKTKAWGNLYYARLNSSEDTALVSIEEDTDWNNEIPDTFEPLKAAISLEQISEGEKVFYYSSLREETVTGIVRKVSADQPINLEYSDGKVKSFAQLLIAGDNSSGSWKTISEKGDSGSILYTASNEPFAMIIGGGKDSTYAIPILPILKETNTHIYLP